MRLIGTSVGCCWMVEGQVIRRYSHGGVGVIWADQLGLGGRGNNNDGPAGSLAGLSEPIDERCPASVLGDSGNDLGGTGSGHWHHHVSGVGLWVACGFIAVGKACILLGSSEAFRTRLMHIVSRWPYWVYRGCGLVSLVLAVLLAADVMLHG